MPHSQPFKGDFAGRRALKDNAAMNIAATTTGSMPLRAVLLGQRLDTKGLESQDMIGVMPLTLRIGERGIAFLFRFGVVVLVGLSADAERALLDLLRPRVTDALPAPEIEQIPIVVRPDGDDQIDASGTIMLKDASMERLQIVADVMSKSVVLALHESQIAGAFDRLEPLAVRIKHKGHADRKARDLIQQIGDIQLVQHRMVGRVAVEDKPDVLWDRPDLERLYARLADEYELSERSQAIDRKLTLAGDTVRTLLELVQDQRSVRLEWYIIGLIFIEILLSGYDIIFRTH
ncbi:MAG: RMD1 family protein [Alphaproteobacteria bacterium]|nr:RMD1 family protein [Alphaproteobacteria bacterium]MBV8409864.1 RMD1 family protein [Alphaproteobacteria bacterium]